MVGTRQIAVGWKFKIAMAETGDSSGTAEDGLAYLERNHVLFYLEDAVAQLITSDVRRRSHHPQPGKDASPATEFVANYFSDV